MNKFPFDPSNDNEQPEDNRQEKLIVNIPKEALDSLLYHLNEVEELNKFMISIINYLIQ